MKKISWVLILLSLVATGCVSGDEVLQPPEAEESTPSTIEETLLEFVASVEPETRAGDLAIESVSRLLYRVERNGRVTIGGTPSRAADADEAEINYVSFTKEGSHGFALLSDLPNDGYLTTLYVPNGCLEDTTFNKGFQYELESALYTNMLLDSISFPFDSIRGSTQEELVIGPITYEQWNQYNPFNIATAVLCNCIRCQENEYQTAIPIGCVTIAVGQCLSTMGRRIPGAPFTDRLVFWNFVGDCLTLDEERKQQLSSFLYEIALGCKIKFAHNGSGTSLFNADLYLTSLGLTVFYNAGITDPDRVVAQLQNYIPVIKQGSEVEGEPGHAWIVDGYKGIKRTNGNFIFHHYYLHSNFGWGGANNCWALNLKEIPLGGGTENTYSQYFESQVNLYITL